MIRRYNLSRSDNYPYNGRISYVCTGSGILNVVTGFPVKSAIVTFSTLPLIITEESMSSSSESSSSESSLTSNSLSSYQCCEDWTGGGAAEFTNWIFNNADKDNTDNCTLYIHAESLVSDEYIYVYSDIGHTQFVAYGYNFSPSLTINLSPVGGSGLSGTVTWSGVGYDGDFTVYCEPVSSSSNSSSSLSSSSMSSVTQSETSETSLIVNGLPRLYVSGYTTDGFIVAYENIPEEVGYIEFSYSAL